jgi:hypothetical protein
MLSAALIPENSRKKVNQGLPERESMTSSKALLAAVGLLASVSGSVSAGYMLDVR